MDFSVESTAALLVKARRAEKQKVCMSHCLDVECTLHVYRSWSSPVYCEVDFFKEQHKQWQCIIFNSYNELMREFSIMNFTCMTCVHIAYNIFTTNV